MLTASQPGHTQAATPSSTGQLRDGADSQCRRYAKFVALTNQMLSRPVAVHCTTVVQSIWILHDGGAKRDGKFTPRERGFTVPLDLGAATCLLID